MNTTRKFGTAVLAAFALSVVVVATDVTPGNAWHVDSTCDTETGQWQISIPDESWAIGSVATVRFFVSNNEGAVEFDSQSGISGDVIAAPSGAGYAVTTWSNSQEREFSFRPSGCTPTPTTVVTPTTEATPTTATPTTEATPITEATPTTATPTTATPTTVVTPTTEATPTTVVTEGSTTSSTVVTATAPEAPTSPTTPKTTYLPSTGDDSGGLIAWAILITIVGGTMLAARRRRPAN